MNKHDKASEEYYKSIMITKDEYNTTLEIAKRHHKHDFRGRRGATGIVFYECKCGTHYAVAFRGGRNER